MLGQVTLNTEIVTTGRVEEVDWYKFQLDGKEVYISKSFLSEEKLELEVVKEPEKTKEEYQQAAQEFEEQFNKNYENNVASGDPNYTNDAFTVVGSGDDIDWGSNLSGIDPNSYTVH